MDSRPVGRDAEIAKICAFLSAASGEPAVLVITGDTGIGKTMMWQHVIQAADSSSRVLSCRPTPAERPFAFSALDDLFGEVVEQILPALPGSQRRAVEVALMRDTSVGSLSAGLSEAGREPERQVLARGVLDVLRILSDSAPLVVAVDDAQWLDQPSADVLEFCLRRLQREPVSILLTLRTNDPVPLGVDRAVPPDRLGRVQLGPLSLGAIGEILQSRLGTALPRYALTRLYEACGGNPYYALECAPTLLDHPQMSVIHEPIPIPRNLGGLIRRRVQRLKPDIRRVGQLVAASSDPRERLIRAAWDDRESWVAIDRAIDVGLIERDGEVLRFTHPLLRSVLYFEMPLDDRRQVHQRLGVVAEDIEKRAWHLALGADRPCEKIAEILDGAAGHAASRGAPEEAATLAEQAARLTPGRRSRAVRERTVHAADYYFRAGDMARSKELIESALHTCPAGPLRTSLVLQLATIYYHQSGWPLVDPPFRRAAEDALDVPALYSHAEQELAFARMVAADLSGASRLAQALLRSAEQGADPRLLAHSLARVVIFEFLLGRGARLDLLDRAEALNTAASAELLPRLPSYDPALVRGLVLKWSDRLDEARPRLADRYRHGIEHGKEASLPFLLYHFSELECWAGNWDAAEEYALEACRIAEESHQNTMRPATLYSLALVRAHQGQVQQARDLASQALAMCDRTGNVPVRSMVFSVLGFIALSLDDAHAAHHYLGRLVDVTTATGCGEPSAVKFLPDEIEALTALGQVDLARSLTRQLEGQGKTLGRPWALATAARCRARLTELDGDLDGARSACRQALSEHQRLPMPFELGRTLLTKGMIEQRAGHQQATSAALSQALTIFERLGAPLWAEKARREISTISVRTSAKVLTETERRIAALVTQGHTNREVASAMFVTQNTVQTHIQHIFQKLGVRSRTELAARLLTAPASTASPARPSGDQNTLRLVRPPVLPSVKYTPEYH